MHIFIATRFKTAQYGRQWNVGARDEKLPPANAMTGRTARAQANFAETFPIAIVALLGVVVADRTSDWTAIGGWLWLGARLVYLPLYAGRAAMADADLSGQHDRHRHGPVAVTRDLALDAPRTAAQRRKGRGEAPP